MKLFIADLNQIINTGDFISTVKTRLCPNDLMRFQNFQNTNRAMQFLAGRYLIEKYVTSDYQTLSSGQVIVPKGYISLAHAKNFVVLAVHQTPVGVDIEEITEKKNYRQIARRMNFQNCQTPLEFFKSWTAFEADFKLKSTDNKPVHTYIKHQNFLICVATLTPTHIEKKMVSF